MDPDYTAYCLAVAGFPAAGVVVMRRFAKVSEQVASRTWCWAAIVCSVLALPTLLSIAALDALLITIWLFGLRGGGGPEAGLAPLMFAPLLLYGAFVGAPAVLADVLLLLIPPRTLATRRRAALRWVGLSIAVHGLLAWLLLWMFLWA